LQPPGHLAIGSWDNTFYGVEASTGRRSWNVQGMGITQVAAAIGGSGPATTAYFVSNSGLVLAVRVVDGVPLWRFELPLGSLTISGPVIGPEGRLIVAAGDGNVYCLVGAYCMCLTLHLPVVRCMTVLLLQCGV
jgi:outer membrane protein assembly factor BamB